MTSDTPVDNLVVIVGGGPVGLIFARVLSHHGVSSLLFERNETTTRWPKMDLTNARSMELFRKIGLADELRKQGVNPDIDQDVLISTGLERDRILTKWDLPSVNNFRARIHNQNDGSQPREPWQRISQAIFEKWLRNICDEDPLIDLRYGWKVTSVAEEAEKVFTTVEAPNGETYNVSSLYVAGCDGGSSTVRKSLGISIDGGPIPVRAVLVHFKSHDLRRLHKHGRFWHIFLTDPSGGLGGAIIAQDEMDTWTSHLFLPADAQDDADSLSSEDVVARVLGGMYGPFPVKIDRILVRSTWRPVVAVSRTWAGLHNRVFLAGDAAHQNIPTGGYGMNMGIADAFDLGWKMASVIHKTGGPALLKSYEMERKPVAERNVARSRDHHQVHDGLKDLLTRGCSQPQHVDTDTEMARETRRRVVQHYMEHDGENTDLGIEMGYRYRSHIIVSDAEESTEPRWTPSVYTPTTWPGSRPPHVFLSDGRAIFDEFGPDWTLITFDEASHASKHFQAAAARLSLPIKILSLSQETLARTLYEKSLLLIRPDQHVAWRADVLESEAEAKHILQVVTGHVGADTTVTLA